MEASGGQDLEGSALTSPGAREMPDGDPGAPGVEPGAGKTAAGHSYSEPQEWSDGYAEQTLCF